jgi:hypothetical protein
LYDLMPSFLACSPREIPKVTVNEIPWTGRTA